MVFDLFCASLTTICELLLPMILRYITNQGIQDLTSITVGMILRIGGVYFLLRIVDGLAAFYMAYTGHVMGARIETDMRQDAFEHLQKLSDSYFNNTKVGQIMARITSDLFDVTEFAHHCPEEFFIAGIKTLISFMVLAGINLPLTVLIFVFIPIMVVSCTYFNLRVKQAFKKQRYQIGELNAKIEDNLLGNRVVRAFANQDIEIEKFREDNQAFLDIKRETYKYMAAVSYTHLDVYKRQGTYGRRLCVHLSDHDPGHASDLQENEAEPAYAAFAGRSLHRRHEPGSLGRTDDPRGHSHRHGRDRIVDQHDPHADIWPACKSGRGSDLWTC